MRSRTITCCGVDYDVPIIHAPPGLPREIVYEVCPEHGWERSGEIACGCEARTEDVECVCNDVGRIYCADCREVVASPARVTYRLDAVKQEQAR